jgi:hypothetical protein
LNFRHALAACFGMDFNAEPGHHFLAVHLH